MCFFPLISGVLIIDELCCHSKKFNIFQENRNLKTVFKINTRNAHCLPSNKKEKDILTYFQFNISSCNLFLLLKFIMEC